MKTQTTIKFEQRVDDRIQSLLARVEGVQRGSDISRPTKFDARGERHARNVARRDEENDRG